MLSVLETAKEALALEKESYWYKWMDDDDEHMKFVSKALPELANEVFRLTAANSKNLFERDFAVEALKQIASWEQNWADCRNTSLADELSDIARAALAKLGEKND